MGAGGAGFSHSRKSSLPAITGFTGSSGSTESALFASSTYEELDQAINQSQTFQDLWRVVRMVSAQLGIAQMVQVMEQHSAHLVQATSVRFFYVDEEARSFVRNMQTYKIDEGIAGYVYMNREIVNLVNPSEDKRFSPAVDQDPMVGVASSLMCVPVLADSTPQCTGDKDVIGVIVGVRERGQPHFSTQDCTVMFRLGEFAGNSLRNARRLESSMKSQKRGKVLLDIAMALAKESSLEKLVSFIVSQVPELLDCDRCTLYFVDHEKEELIVTPNASHGRKRRFQNWVFGTSNAPQLPFAPGQKELRFSMRKGLAGHVAVTGETVNIRDGHEDPRFNNEIDKETGYRTRSILCMPMRDSDGHIIGVLQAINKNPAFPQFDKEDEVMLATFSAQAAVAVRNSKLLQATEAARLRSEALLRVSHHMSKELNLGKLLNVIMSEVQPLLKAQRCTLFIVDEERKELYTNDKMSVGMGAALPIDHEKDEMIRFPMNRGIAGNVATTGDVINIPDAYKDERFNKAMDKETGFVTTSILCIPVVDRNNKILGVTQVINKVDGEGRVVAFDRNDEELLSAFSAQAAVVIHNSRLFTETEKALTISRAEQRNLKWLLSVTKNLFSDMHLSSMIEQMTMQVHHLLKADNCALYLVDNEKQEYYLAKDENAKGAPRARYPFSRGIVGYVARTAQTVRISKAAHTDARFDEAVDQRGGFTTHSILCCPITAESQDATTVIGVISVRDEKDRGGFEREEENLLRVFCAQAAVAIINAKRFSKWLEPTHHDEEFVTTKLEEHGVKFTPADIDSFQYSMDQISLLERIGNGAYGEVWKAMIRDPKTDEKQIVAVKKLHVKKPKKEQLESFCQEATLMCQLKHDNIVAFIGAVTEPSNLCIITQFCARGSLADMLLNHSIEISYSMKLRFAENTAQGMRYLHGCNPIILHRDLKSDNLLVADDFTVKVADFGLTRFISEKKAMTQVGTPMWMAPEIIMGKKYTEKADVYAFGIILWEILTRLEPYEDKEPMQIVVEVVNNDLRPTIPEQFKDASLVSLMKDCWDPDPNKRPTFNIICDRLSDLIKQDNERNARSGVGAAAASMRPAAAAPVAAAAARK